MPERLSESLRAACEGTWSATLEHRFMQALRDRSLPRQTFARFLIHRFVERLVLLAQAIVLANTFEARLRVARAVGSLTDSEDVFYRDAFRLVGVDAAALANTPSTQASQEFATLMQHAGDSASYPAVVAIVCQADWLYLDCATQRTSATAGSLHMRWIKQYSNNLVRGFVEVLRRELDRVGPTDLQRAGYFFLKENELEAAFLDAMF
jgi:thiaminase (transcriptional activator TenA)